MNERDLTKTQARRLTKAPPQRAPEGREFLCIGPQCWGRGATDQEALKNATRPKRYILYDVDPGTKVDEMGGFVYTPKAGVEPYREVRRVINGRQIASPATSPWKRIADETPPKGEDVVLYFPAEGRTLSPMKRIDSYPVGYPRKPTLWLAIPEVPDVWR